MKVDVIIPAPWMRVQMNWHRAEWHIALIGKQTWHAANNMDLLTVLKLDEAAWHFINQFESEVNRRVLRGYYELNAGRPKPDDWNAYFDAEEKVRRADKRFAEASRDLINDSWYEESNGD